MTFKSKLCAVVFLLFSIGEVQAQHHIDDFLMFEDTSEYNNEILEIYPPKTDADSLFVRVAKLPKNGRRYFSIYQVSPGKLKEIKAFKLRGYLTQTKHVSSHVYDSRFCQLAVSEDTILFNFFDIRANVQKEVAIYDTTSYLHKAPSFDGKHLYHFLIEHPKDQQSPPGESCVLLRANLKTFRVDTVYSNITPLNPTWQSGFIVDTLANTLVLHYGRYLYRYNLSSGLLLESSEMPYPASFWSQQILQTFQNSNGFAYGAQTYFDSLAVYQFQLKNFQIHFRRVFSIQREERLLDIYGYTFFPELGHLVIFNPRSLTWSEGNIEFAVYDDGKLKSLRRLPYTNTTVGATLLTDSLVLYITGLKVRGFRRYGFIQKVTLSHDQFANGIESADFVCYPNPFNEVLTFELPTGFSNCLVFDLSGNTVLNAPLEYLGQNKFNLNTSHLKNGLYYVLPYAEGQSEGFSPKLVLKKR